MIKRTLQAAHLACLAVLSAMPPASLLAASPEHNLVSEFEPWFRQQVQSEHVTGAAFVVATPEEIVRIGTAGHTDTSRQQAINENTVFRVASVSKTFAAGLAGILVREGEFGWDDRVKAYVPEFRLKGDEREVRIRHLLGQSTGLIPHAYDNLIEDGLTMDRIQPQFRKLDYLCVPGSCYSYQNSIFSLIEPVMEVTTNQTYAELINRKIFEPLDMRDSSVGYEALVNNPNHARPHVKSKGRWKTVQVKPNYYRVAPAAGVNASILDMGKWLQAQMGARPDVLAPETVQTLVTPRVKTVRDKHRKHWRDYLSDAHYGLGWRIYTLGEHDIAYHSGWVSGYRADVAWSADHDIGIAVLMNVEDSTISQVTTQFWQMAFEQLPAQPGAAATVAAVIQ
jgi:beta-lactamase class C